MYVLSIVHVNVSEELLRYTLFSIITAEYFCNDLCP